MKALSSFSSPSSPNGGKTQSSASQKQTTAGCLSRLIRRILCLRSLSTCPFDYLKEDGDERLLDGSMVGSSDCTIPGVVARLMGLESLPLLTYQEAKDDNFFIFNFEADEERRRSHKRKSTVRRIDSMGSKVFGPSDHCGGKTEQEISCDLVEDNSENSSPGSALQFVGFPYSHQQTSSSSSSEDVSRLRNARMRRTLSEELDRCDSSKDTRGASMIHNNGFVVGRRKEKQSCWDGEIEAEVVKLSWVEDEMYRNQKYLKEIGRDVASQILGHLLDELISTYIF